MTAKRRASPDADRVAAAQFGFGGCHICRPRPLLLASVQPPKAGAKADAGDASGALVVR
jgi:hypothetical protein